jgi:hypothetical protein
MQEGRKTSLKEAAGEILELRDALKEYVGEGNRDIFVRERHQADFHKDAPRYCLPDLNGNDVRNRYLDKYQRYVELCQ